MKDLSKELLSESQAQRCIFNYFTEVWEQIKNNQPEWMDGKFKDKYEFLKYSIDSLRFNAKITADNDLENEIINQDKYNEILNIFGVVIENGQTKYD
jgi:hypothetical protein